MNVRALMCSAALSLSALAGCGEVGSHGSRAVSISQALSMDVTDGIGCEQDMTKFIREQSFYRAFQLSDFDVTGELHLNQATVGVFSATAGMSAHSQTVQLRIYSYTGALGGQFLDATKMNPVTVDNATITVNDTANPKLIDQTIQADLPAGTPAIVAEIFIPEGAGAQNQFEIGANTQGDHAPAYQRAVCNPTVMPTELTQITGLMPYSLVLSLTGTTDD